MALGVLALALTGCPKPGPKPEPPPVTHVSAVVGERPLSPETIKAFASHPAVGTAVPVEAHDGAAFKFVVDEVEPAGKGVALNGHVEGAPGSTGTIVVIGETVAGSIHVLGRPVYVLTRTADGRPIVRGIDTSKLPPDHPPGFDHPIKSKGGGKPPTGPGDNPGDTCTTDDPTHVTAMILYTTAAKNAAGGTDAIEASIYAAIAQANLSFVNSDINTQYDLVHVEEVSYTAVLGDFTTDVCRLHDPADGYMDDVPTKRNTYQADLVALVVDSGGFCGLTYGQLVDPSVACTNSSNHAVVGSPSNAHEEGAYHVFVLSCIQTNFTLPHEFGHSGSARHNWQCDGTDNSPTHSDHGSYYDDGTAANSWRTILTYPSNTTCGHNGGRVPYFSNPAISFSGNPTGSSTGTQPTDNHDVLNTTRSILANYRCSSPPPGNVWMKDTWGDTGAEPDPDPDIMYASPYIWTRTSQDTLATGMTDRYQHEHQHQNPVLHQPAWAYVKLHNNGAAAATGHVKLYWGNGSTSLAWPALWTQIADIPVTAASFAAGATKVVEIPWSDPPGSGHYCLTARWESAADPIPPESTDINANTRNSNNVIWRNLEILSTGTGDAADTSFIVRPFGNRMMTLEFVTPGRRPFLPHGEIDVALKAVNAPLEAKAAEGVTQVGPGKFKVTASGGRIQLVIPQEKAAHVVVDMRLRRTKANERRLYRVLVNQFEMLKERQPVRVGGVAYDLQP
jgi:hypothetical protein